ncbi:MAG: hypothetical protein JNN20_13170 [Betaproteobacteria bacterium]|nr:hypothetical protein [Betaproteobacteria bacterium]
MPTRSHSCAFRMSRWLFALLPMLLAACATKPPQYPQASIMSVVASKGTVDLSTEVPADDYLLPDSQVFVGGRESGAVSTIAGGFGVLGVAVGMSINRTKNANALEGTHDAMRLSFAAEQADTFFRMAEARAPGRFVPLKPNTKAHFVLVPSARLNFGEQGDAHVSFRTKVSFLDRDTALESGKNFYYTSFERRNIKGVNSWSEDNAKAMKALAAKAMPLITEAILDDMDGRLQRASSPLNPRFVMLRPKSLAMPAQRMLVLKENAEQILVAPAPRDQVFSTVVMIFERDAVEMTGVSQ